MNRLHGLALLCLIILPAPVAHGASKTVTPPTGNPDLDSLFARQQITTLSVNDRGIPESITGRFGPSVAFADPVEIVWQFIQEYRTLFHMTRPINEEWVLRARPNTRRDPVTVEFDQVYKGVPVLYGTITGRVRNRRDISSLQIQYFDGIEVNVVPSLTAERAKQRVADLAGSSSVAACSFQPPTLMVAVNESGPHLIWRVRAECPPIGRDVITGGEFFIDAHSGEPLKFERGTVH